MICKYVFPVQKVLDNILLTSYKVSGLWLSMVFNVTFNNISVISRWSVLLAEEARVPEKTTDLPQVTDKLYHILFHSIIFILLI
jgi:hypothetical protein